MSTLELLWLSTGSYLIAVTELNQYRVAIGTWHNYTLFRILKNMNYYNSLRKNARF